MYRYQVDNVITYTSEDVVLFRESPFACWMERLTLENPGHGIPPDVGASALHNNTARQDEIAEILRSEGRDVALIDWEEEEPWRRAFTLDAMRAGTDFIVNGQLALGNLSGSANLLMRTSGYSEWGDFLYIPCDTQAKTTLHSTFRLCFLVDLLHSLQGQLPPQMLIIRGGSNVIPLQCEDHIYHYRAVKQRFMDAMRDFRKHRMPDPAESSHFGRWSDCANEVLKQRALRREQMGEALTDESARTPRVQAVSAAVGGDTYDGGGEMSPPLPGGDAAQAGRDSLSLTVSAQMMRAEMVRQVGATPTLAEQARMLDAGVYQRAMRTRRPGFTPNLAQLEDSSAAPPAGGRPPPHQRENSDLALENFSFVGRSPHAPVISMESLSDDDAPALATGCEPPPPTLKPPLVRVTPDSLDSTGGFAGSRSIIDLDDSPLPSPAPTLATADTPFAEDHPDRAEFGERERRTPRIWREREESASDSEPEPFKDALITSEHYLSD